MAAAARGLPRAEGAGGPPLAPRRLVYGDLDARLTVSRLSEELTPRALMTLMMGSFERPPEAAATSAEPQSLLEMLEMQVRPLVWPSTPFPSLAARCTPSATAPGTPADTHKRITPLRLTQ